MAEALRRVVSSCPPGRLEELVARWLQLPQVLCVLASQALIDSRIELEADLVTATGDTQYQPAIATSLNSSLESRWETEIQEIRWSCVQPIITKASVSKARSRSDLSISILRTLLSRFEKVKFSR